MIVLLCYSLILHLIIFVVLHVKYVVLRGKLEPVTWTLPVHKPCPGAVAMIRAAHANVHGNGAIQYTKEEDTEVEV